MVTLVAQGLVGLSTRRLGIGTALLVGELSLVGVA